MGLGRAALVLVAVLGVGCDDGLEGAFIQGRAEDPCLQNIAACAGLYAGCVLNDTRFARTTFPGAFRFLVSAEPKQEIEVALFFAGQRDAGLSTQILWNEPGCTDVYSWDSEGGNLFKDAEDTGYISEKHEILEDGEHLIEIYSDMQADVIVAVNVITPGT